METKIVAILNQKGGVGKTTTTINAAAYLAKKGRKVLIIDGDPQGNATSGLGLDKNQLNKTLYDVILGQHPANKAVIEIGGPGLHLLPSNAGLASAEIELVNQIDREGALKKALENIAGYDYIFIDCPPALGLLTINALTAADYVFIPVQAEYYALEGLSQLLQLVQEVKTSLNPKLEILGVVITMYDSRNSLSNQVHTELASHFGDKLFRTVIPRNVRLAEAPSFGRTIHEHDRFSRGARAYKQLAREIDAILSGEG